MKNKMTVARIVFTLFLIGSIGLFFLFIAQEIQANRIAAVWANAGFPDLRAPHHNYFWARIYACVGVACLSFGVLIGLHSNES